MKILYITGWGRSGSTILGNVISEIDGFFHTGELNYIWENGLIRNDSCGCDQPVKSCGVWSAVFDEAFGGAEAVDPECMIHRRDEAPKNRAVLKDLLGLQDISWGVYQAYIQTLGKLYRAICTVTGCEVMLDSSKAPSYGYLLSQLPGFEVYYLHLVRDARATAFSWQRKVQRQDARQGRHMERHTLLENAKRWMLCNVISELIGWQRPGRYIRVRYEDFVRAPVEVVGAITRFAGQEIEELPFAASHQVRLGTNHTVWGNPKRAVRGDVRIRQDDTWRMEMEPSSRWMTQMLTWPLLWRYTYLKS